MSTRLKRESKRIVAIFAALALLAGTMTIGFMAPVYAAGDITITVRVLDSGSDPLGSIDVAAYEDDTFSTLLAAETTDPNGVAVFEIPADSILYCTPGGIGVTTGAIGDSDNGKSFTWEPENSGAPHDLTVASGGFDVPSSLNLLCNPTSSPSYTGSPQEVATVGGITAGYTLKNVEWQVSSSAIEGYVDNSNFKTNAGTYDIRAIVTLDGYNPVTTAAIEAEIGRAAYTGLTTQWYAIQGSPNYELKILSGGAVLSDPAQSYTVSYSAIDFPYAWIDWETVTTSAITPYWVKIDDANGAPDNHDEFICDTGTQTQLPLTADPLFITFNAIQSFSSSIDVSTFIPPTYNPEISPVDIEYDIDFETTDNVLQASTVSAIGTVTYGAVGDSGAVGKIGVIGRIKNSNADYWGNVVRDVTIDYAPTPEAIDFFTPTGWKEHDGYWWFKNDVIFQHNTADVTTSSALLDPSVWSGSAIVSDEGRYGPNGMSGVTDYTLAFKYKTGDPNYDDGDITSLAAIQPFGIDKTSPSPSSIRFDFSRADYQEDKEGDNGSATSTAINVVETTYGYYFAEDTYVTISALDDSLANSGIEFITFYKDDIDDVTDGISTAITTAAINISSGGGGYIDGILIPAGFKGQLYAYATDYADNSSVYVHPDGVIVENPIVHTTTSSIDFTVVPVELGKQNNYFDHINNNPYVGDSTAIAYAITDGAMDYTDGKVPLINDNSEFGVEVQDTYSGIRNVRWAVVAPGNLAVWENITIDGTGNFSGNSLGWAIESRGVDEDGTNLVTSVKNDAIPVTGNSNDMALVIELTDRAGNVSYDYYCFGIDTTNPTIEVSYNNDSAENGKYFKANRTATITVTERNFDPALNPNLVTSTVTTVGGQVPNLVWSSVATGTGDDTKHTATLAYTADGDYKYTVSAKDLAGNANDPVAYNGTAPRDFTIDKIAPTVTVSYDNNNPLNGNYYAQSRTATVAVTEHNFNGANIIGSATDNGAPVAFPGASFRGNGDIHTATLAYTADALYNFDITVTDLAGNLYDSYPADEFYVDTTAPEIVISNVEDQSANNDVVMPVVTFSDTNYDTNGVGITLTGANNGEVTPTGAYAAGTNGQVFSFEDFERVKASDDLYTLNANIVDMAGNTFEDTINFSVNRFGSVYVFHESLESIIGEYVNEEFDVKFQEINVDSLDHDTIDIKVSKNGATNSLEALSDYTYEKTSSPGEWSVYEYTVPKKHFANDANYLVQVYSVDLAGNINENIAEEKEAEIGFAVDKTAPVIVVSDLESDGRYNVDSKSVNASVKDNLKLEKVSISLNGDSVEYENSGESYDFVVPSKNSSQQASVVAVDAAGNEATFDANDFLVTTNVFVKWFYNKPLFYGSIAGAIVIIGAALFLLSRRGLLFGGAKRQAEED